MHLSQRKKRCPKSEIATRYKGTLANVVWIHTGRSTIGFVRVRDSAPASLGSGTLIRFGNIAGVLTCAHVLEALVKEDNIGILCFPVRARQIQRLQVSISMTDSIAIGSAPWGESGPDLAFLRLPAAVLGDIERVATIANGDLHRQNIAAGDPARSRKVCAIAGVVDDRRKPRPSRKFPMGLSRRQLSKLSSTLGMYSSMTTTQTGFGSSLLQATARFCQRAIREQAAVAFGNSYLAQDDFALVQARLVGVAYWEKPFGDELHLVGHGQISIYETLFNAIHQKWGVIRRFD